MGGWVGGGGWGGIKTILEHKLMVVICCMCKTWHGWQQGMASKLNLLYLDNPDRIVREATHRHRPHLHLSGGMGRIGR